MLDGTTTNCPGSLCNYINHRGQAYIQLGSNSASTTYTPWMNPTSYMTISNQQSVVIATGEDLPGTAEVSVDCTQVGQFYSSAFPPIMVTFTITYWGPPITENAFGGGTWNTLVCTNGTKAWCTNKSWGVGFNSYPNCPPYVKNTWVVVNGECVTPVPEGIAKPGPCS